jgi:hypothetical protein
MYNIVKNEIEGLFYISDEFNINAGTSSVDETPYFNSLEESYVISFPNLEGVTKLTRFTYDTLGLTDNRFLLQYYRISRDGISWSEWLDLKRDIDNFPIVDPLDPLYLEIKWTRKGLSETGNIRLLEYKIEGLLDRPISDDGSTISLLPGETKVIRAPFIFKVFRIDDVEIISPTGIDGANIKWRFSQDSTRTWSDFEILTKDNIRTKRINPIRFFQVEYSIENTSSSNITIQDINLIGDFQNVSLDSQKTNLFGIRECCQSNLLGTYDANGNFIPNTTLNQTGGGSGACAVGSTLPQMTTDDKANLYNPYQQSAAINLLTKLSTDAQQIFGHRVIYFATDVDKKGQDHTLHEYQLYNVVCEGEIKVSIEGNSFPDSQIVMNQFDLNLFETMEAHITKQQFKEVFGVQRRPAKEDFLYFCDLNRMYQVEHAQQYRNFNNSAVYYKLILKKYSQKANVKADNVQIKNTLDMLTKNTTIDELFGQEQTQDKAAIANKQQFKPLTKDPIRLEIIAQIDKELIENSTTIISKSHYDLSSVDYRQPAVVYRNLDPIINETDNIGFQIWFNINNYIPGEIYNFFNYYNETLSQGWKTDLQNDKITVTLNSTSYTFDLMGNDTDGTIALNEETWYCYVLNIDQRNRKIGQWIYKRDVEDEEDAANLSYTILKRLYKNEQDISTFRFEAEGFNSQILASDMKATNIRVFLDVIPEDTHNKILNQYVIREDSKYLVFADNATTRLFLPSFPLFE